MLIFGAGGHALELVQIAMRCRVLDESAEHYFVTSGGKGSTRDGLPFPCIEETEALSTQYAEGEDVILAIGSSAARSKVASKIFGAGLNVRFPNLIDPAAIVSGDLRSSPDRGLVVFPGAFVSTRVSIAQHCHVNALASVSHEASLSAFCTVSPQAVVCGNVSIGERVFLGANCTVLDGLSIAADITVGGGAVVISPLSEPGTYSGVPARAHRLTTP